MDPQAPSRTECDSCNDLAITVLALVVERWPPASKDPKTLCSLLQVSSGVRHALQISTGHASVQLALRAQQPRVHVPAFAAWLPAHAGLVKRISVEVPRKNSIAFRHDTYADSLAAAFQQCAVEPPARSAGRITRARAAAAARPPRMPLQLAALSLCLPSRDELRRAPALLHALPASSRSLTRLELEALAPPYSHDNGRSVGVQALPLLQLGSLKHLSLGGILWRPESHSLGHFSPALTHLSLELVASSVSQLLLPPALHSLALTVTPRDPYDNKGGKLGCDSSWALVPVADAPNRPTSLDYSSLGHVRRLHVEPSSVQCYTGDRHGALALRLPPQLTALRLLWPCSNIVGLQQPSVLAELHLYGYCLSNSRLLQLLSEMPRLQDVKLVGDLGGRDTAQDLTVGEACQLAATLGSASALTSLVLQQYRVDGTEGGALMGVYDVEPDDVRVDWCRELSQLSSLQKLGLSCSVHPDDALHLTALTALTALHIDSCAFVLGSYLDDAGVGMLCSRLKRLQHLTLVESGLQDAQSVLNSLQSLTGLTCLQLAQPLFGGENFGGRMCVRAADLPRLAPLSRLQRLTLPLHPDVCEEEVQQFCDGHMPLLAADCVSGDSWGGLE